jgi:hypothetical protein
MFAAALPFVAAGASALASYMGNRETNSTNRHIAADTNTSNTSINSANNAYNAAAAQKQMDFQERMSNTSYQRARTDMLSAGINPILAYTQGGASSPGGAQASASSIPSQTGAPAVNNMAGVVSSAVDSATTVANIANLLAQNEKIRADTKVSTIQAAVLAKDIDLKSASARKVLADSKLSEADLPIRQLEGSVAGLATRGLGKVVGLAHSGASTYKAFKSVSRSKNLHSYRNISSVPHLR